MGWLWRSLGRVRRGMAWVLVAVLLATNVLAFTSTAFVAAVSAVVAATGYTTTFVRERLARRAAVRAVANRIAARTARGAARTVASVPLKALPFAGGVAVVTFTSWELYEDCQTMQDLATLDDTPLDTDTASVCGIPYPSWDDLWRTPTIDVPADMPPAP